MELLILKTGSKYLRVTTDGFASVGLDKASVFPMERLEQVRTLERQARTGGFAPVSVKKLVLTEEDLE